MGPCITVMSRQPYYLQEIKRFPKAIGIGSLIGTFIGATGAVVGGLWPMITPSDF